MADAAAAVARMAAALREIPPEVWLAAELVDAGCDELRAEELAKHPDHPKVAREIAYWRDRADGMQHRR